VERVKEPLIRIPKRDNMPFWMRMCIRVGAVLIALLISDIFITASADGRGGFFEFFGSLFSGAFGSERRIWLLLQNTALLLLVALALVVAFKMRFWNLGGNGQVLMGCLACAICMFYMGGKVPDGVLWLIMLVASLAAGAIWALIPAIFKAFFNTNESLFPLMMNSIAMFLVAFFFAFGYPQGPGAVPPFEGGATPPLGGGQAGRSLLPVIVAVVVTALIFCYLRFSKHGFEISLVGESKNTARYAGINVKKVIIRTLVLSGALCGLVGFLLVGSINHMVSTNMDGNMGFTGIMVAWMGKFNPLIMAGVSFFIIFLSRGMAQVCTDFGFTSTSLSDIVVGLIYFFLIGCEFFIVYKVHFNFRKHTNEPTFSMAAQTAGAEDAGGAAAEEGTQFSAFAAPEEREAEPPEQSLENAPGTSEKHGEEN